MSNLVDWELAERIATRLARRNDPFADSYHYASLQPDFAELTAEAEELVAECTGLRSQAGPARARVADRAGWVHANIASFQRLLRPVTDRLEERLPERGAPPLASKVAGVEVGSLLGWMSARVLGQYDLLVVEDNPAEQDIVYYVGTERARSREAVRLPAPRVPAVARAPRDDAPCAVHRRAVDAWLLPVAGRADPWLGRSRPEAVRRGTEEGSGGRTRWSEPTRRRRAGRAACDARATSDTRQGRRLDESARGPRRRDDGPRWARGSSRARAASAACCASGVVR